MNPKLSALKTKIGGQSTPSMVKKEPIVKAAAKPMTEAPLKRPTAGSNAQTNAYGKAMRSAMKNTQNYGLISR